MCNLSPHITITTSQQKESLPTSPTLRTLPTIPIPSIPIPPPPKRDPTRCLSMREILMLHTQTIRVTSARHTQETTIEIQTEKTVPLSPSPPPIIKPPPSVDNPLPDESPSTTSSTGIVWLLLLFLVCLHFHSNNS